MNLSEVMLTARFKQGMQGKGIPGICQQKWVNWDIKSDESASQFSDFYSFEEKIFVTYKLDQTREINYFRFFFLFNLKRW